MTRHGNPPGIPLPADWSQHVRSATLHVISLVQFALARVSILELRAARAWFLQQTADAFLVTPATIAYWMKRFDGEGPDALVQIREPVNKFPGFVRYAVQRLEALCPGLGKVKIARILCRAGLHLGATTVGRILKESPPPEPPEASRKAGRVVTAKDPNDVWHIDLTAVPIGGGLWTPRLPFSLPQCWPFCWWLAVVVDHFSRRVIGFAAFSERPNSLAVRTFIGKTAAHIHATPKYLICDKESIFWCTAFKRWRKRKAIGPRYGAIGRHGSIAVVERLIRTIKDEATRRIVVPQRQASFRRELASFFVWYNEHRPHTKFGGRTPNDVYFRLRPENRRPRIEPRKRWWRNACCAAPRTLIAGQLGDRFTFEIGDYPSSDALKCCATAGAKIPGPTERERVGAKFSERILTFILAGVKAKIVSRCKIATYVRA